MKTINSYLLSLLFVLFVWTAATAQQWHPFPGAGPFIYTFSDSNNTLRTFFAARIDSVRQEGPDSAYYLYRMDRRVIDQELQLDCNGDTVVLSAGLGNFVLDVDHCFGKKMLMDTQGISRFVSTMGDTFRLHLRAPVGATWAWQPGVLATVTGQYLDTILGVPDSVKDIQLGNGQLIRLSQSHGFVQTFSFLPMVSYMGTPFTAQYTLWGLPDMALGSDLPHYQEIYDFDAGDVFCSYSGTNSLSGYDPYSYRQRTILSRLGCTVPAYENLHEVLQIFPMAGQTYTPPYVQVDPCSIDQGLANLLGLLPYEHNRTFETGPIGTVMMQDGYSIFFNNPQRIVSHYYNVPGIPDCENLLIPFESGVETRYISGLGRYYYRKWYDGHYTDLDYIYAYHTATDSIGTCMSLAIGMPEAAYPSLVLKPNPARDRVMVEWGANGLLDAGHLLLTDMQGRTLQTFQLENNLHQLELDVHDLPSGIYVVALQGSSTVLRQRLSIQR